MIRITNIGRKFKTVRPADAFLPGLPDEDVEVSGFQPEISVPTEVRRVLALGRHTIPLGPWKAAA